ncbi:MAG: toxin-antitoxin system HicB family antitoxin [Chloroflexi bacterium]|nr:toxin-antitoxin system HicB family antitoxin [Chloroflexota bacterium]
MARRGQAKVVFGDVEIPVPEVPEENAQAGDAESVALAAGLTRAVAEGRMEPRKAGAGIPADEMYRELGLEPPEAPEPPRRRPTGRRPDPESDFSGRLMVRLPKSVHRELAERAEEEGISINQLVLSYVSRGLGVDQASTRSRERQGAA